MRLRDERYGIAVLLWALAACDGLIPASEEDVMEDAGSDEPRSFASDAAKAEASDAGMSEGDTPQPDGSSAGQDAASSNHDAATLPVDATAQKPDASVASTGPCGDTDGWDSSWAAYEDEVLRLTNQARAAGHNCDTEGNFGGTTPLTMNANLRCAARSYSKDMGDNDFFAHTGLDGSTVATRIESAGYEPKSTWGENIALGQSTPADVVKAWLDSDGHCRNIMDPRFKEIGVGYYPAPSGTGSKPYWTQDFGG